MEMSLGWQHHWWSALTDIEARVLSPRIHPENWAWWCMLIVSSTCLLSCTSIHMNIHTEIKWKWSDPLVGLLWKLSVCVCIHVNARRQPWLWLARLLSTVSFVGPRTHGLARLAGQWALDFLPSLPHSTGNALPCQERQWPRAKVLMLVYLTCYPLSYLPSSYFCVLIHWYF